MKIFGKKIMSPTKIATNTDISTAPAATSFVSRAYGWYSGEVRSISISKAVLSASVTKTIPIVNTINSHSVVEIHKINPRYTASKAKNI